jgi:hypothetical protein
MQRQYGIEAVDEMIANSKKVGKEWSKSDYQNIIDKYTQRIVDLSKQLTE